MLMMEWNSGGARGYVSGDDEGHPTSVVCASGWGSYESGAEYSVEEVVFCPTTQRTVRESCGDSEFQKLMGLLAKRKVPDGLYVFSEGAGRAIWQDESRILMRYPQRAMAWAGLDGSVSTVIEGLEAQALDVDYSFRFSDAEKSRIDAALPKGADGMAAMRGLFGNDLAGLRLMSEKTDSYNDWTRREWRVQDSGIIHLAVNRDGGVEYFYLMERGDAYVLLVKNPGYML